MSDNTMEFLEDERRRVIIACAMYKIDPVLFVKECLNANPTEQQISVLKKIGEPNARISIRSGRGTGKTTLLSWIILWFLSFNDDTKIICTAPNAGNLRTNLWGECRKWHEKMPDFFKNAIEINSSIIRIKESKTRFAEAKTARKENPEALLGSHASGGYMIIADESPGIADTIFEYLEGSLTTGDCRVVMVGNPTKTHGFFYESHTKNKAFWNTFHFSCIDSPNVNIDFINKARQQYGEESNYFRVHILGEFPLMQKDALIDFDAVQSAFDRDVKFIGLPFIAGVDVGDGGDPSAIVIRQGKDIVHADQWNVKDLMKTVGKIQEYYIQYKLEKIFIDVIGVGAGVHSRLVELNLPMYPVNVNEMASSRARFKILRNELWWRVREFFESKDCHINPELPYKDELVGELSMMTYEVDEASGTIQIISKKKLRSAGKKSPNIADALMHTMADGYILPSTKGIIENDVQINSSSSGWSSFV